MQKTLVVNSDKRQQYLLELLDAKEISVDTVEEDIKVEGFEEIVLPTPVASLTWHGDICRKIRQELSRMPDPIRIYGGAFSVEWKQFLEEQIHTMVDLMQDPIVKKENAKITAEAVVAEYLRHSEVSIEGSRIFVTGYGECGSEIAKRFFALGAKVIVFARSREARMKAREAGLWACSFAKEMEEDLSCEAVINTVPGLVVGERMIGALKEGTLILEVASAPGGIDLECAQKKGMRVEKLMGLPGRYTTRSSAGVLYRAICRDRKFRGES